MQALLRRGDNEFDSYPQPGEHVDEAVHTEEVDASPDQITHAGLGYTKKSGGLALSRGPSGPVGSG